MINKTPDIMEHLIDRDPSIVFVSETWLKTLKSNVTALVKEYGYTLLHNPRKGRKKEDGGGVGILLKRDISYKPVNHSQFSSFEHKMLRVEIGRNLDINIQGALRTRYSLSKRSC